MRCRLGYGAGAVLACGTPAIAQAHSFGTPYILPVPLWIYAYGCAATVILTFGLLAWLGHESAQLRTPVLSRPHSIPVALLRLLRTGAVACLALTIWAGLSGADDPNRNVAMTLFWVMFLLGFAYLTMIVGNLYALANPWRTAVDLIERAGIDLSVARLAYPTWLGSWPASLAYFALIHIELFTAGTPALLVQALAVYSLTTLAGCFLFGKRPWFERSDLFSTYFRIIAMLAPVAYRESDAGGWSLHFRAPVIGALDERPADLGTVLFVLFMLSSTAYDGLHETDLWIGLYWTNALSLFLPIWDGDLGKAQTALMESFLAYRWLGLLLFPFAYLGLYRAALVIARIMSRAAPRAGEAIYLFCFSLVPIAVAYNFAHYFAFVVAQLESLPALLSDPLGRAPAALLPSLDMGVIWHLQVGAILLGHVLSVWLAHLMAVRAVGDGRGVVVGQLPLLALMVAYTIFGLWILSLPLG